MQSGDWQIKPGTYGNLLFKIKNASAAKKSIAVTDDEINTKEKHQANRVHLRELIGGGVLLPLGQASGGPPP